MDILYIAEEIGVPGIDGGSTHVTETIDSLASLGHKVHVICKQNEGQKTNETKKGVIYTRIPLPKTALQKNLFLFLTLGETIKQILKQNKIDLVWQRYRIFGLQGIIEGKKKGIKTLIELNEPIETSESSLLYPLIKKWFLYILPYADRVFGQHQCEIWHATKQQRRLFTNGSNPLLFNPKRINAQISKKYGLKGNTIFYSGSFQDWHCLKNALEAFKKVQLKFPQSKFILAGNGPQKKELEKYVKDNNILGIIFLGGIEYKKLAYYINSSDVCIALFDRNFPAIKKYGYFYSPVKVFDYKACGKPIIASNIGNLKPLVMDNITGYEVNEQDIEDISAAIEKVFTNKKLAKQIGQNNIKEIKQKYTWKTVTQRILEETL